MNIKVCFTGTLVNLSGFAEAPETKPQMLGCVLDVPVAEVVYDLATYYSEEVLQYEFVVPYDRGFAEMLHTSRPVRVCHWGEIISVGWAISAHLKAGEVYSSMYGISIVRDLHLGIPARYPRAIRNWALAKYLLDHFIQAANQRAGVLSALSHAE